MNPPVETLNLTHGIQRFCNHKPKLAVFFSRHPERPGEGVIIAEIDLPYLQSVRENIPMCSHRRL